MAQAALQENQPLSAERTKSASVFSSKLPSYIMHATKFGNSGAKVMTQLINKNPPRETIYSGYFVKGSSEEIVFVNFGLEYPYIVRVLCLGPRV